MRSSPSAVGRLTVAATVVGLGALTLGLVALIRSDGRSVAVVVLAAALLVGALLVLASQHLSAPLAAFLAIAAIWTSVLLLWLLFAGGRAVPCPELGIVGQPGRDDAAIARMCEEREAALPTGPDRRERAAVMARRLGHRTRRNGRGGRCRHNSPVTNPASACATPPSTTPTSSTPGRRPRRSASSTTSDPRSSKGDALARGPLRDERNGTLIVEVIETGEPIGTVGWHGIGYGPNSASRAWNIGIALIPSARGHGYGGEAQRLLAEELFRTTDANRVEASTDVENLPEQRALEKAGFTREGSGAARRCGRARTTTSSPIRGFARIPDPVPTGP